MEYGPPHAALHDGAFRSRCQDYVRGLTPPRLARLAGEGRGLPPMPGGVGA